MTVTIGQESERWHKLPSRNEDESAPDLLPVLYVLVAKEVHEVPLLGAYPGIEEAPEDSGKDECAERVAEEDLGAQRPGEEARVGGVPRVGVDALRDEDVVGALRGGDLVREVRGGVDHGRRTDVLPYQDGDQACCGSVSVPGMEGLLSVMRSRRERAIAGDTDRRS